MILFGLGLLELAVAVFIGICFLISCLLDRRASASAWKWLVLIGAVVYYGLPYSNDFGQLTSQVFNFQTFKIFAVYAAIGVLYTLIEFSSRARTAQEKFAEHWKEFLKGKFFISGTRSVTVLALLKHFKGEEPIADAFQDEDGTRRALHREIRENVMWKLNDASHVFKVVEGDDLAVNIKVDRGAVLSSVPGWVIFWPFYAATLVLEELLAKVWDHIATFVISASDKLIKRIFKDTFKV